MQDISFNLESVFQLLYSLGTGDYADISSSFGPIYSTYKSVALVVSLALLVGIIYSLVRIYQIRSEEALFYGTAKQQIVSDVLKNEKWEKVEEHMNSENPNDWRLAILEADIMLDEIVSRMHLPGETLGERMKAIEKSEFQTIDKAWEAHKVRNDIAHGGSDFILTKRRAREVIELFREVFEEFHYI